ncbi:MAG: hypothetical protein ABIX01_18140 [Chitinophagaceae bacterium]
MITITDRAVITKEKHLITVDVGDQVPVGEYILEIILNEVKEKTKRTLSLRHSDYPIKPFLTFSRGEIYGDDER